MKKITFFGNIHKSLAIGALTCLVSIGTYAQKVSPEERRGNKDFENYAFSKAIEHYDRVNNKNENVYRNMAESYRYMGNTEKAEEYYAKCVDRGSDPNDMYYYAAMLRSNGKYQESEEWMKKYHSAVKTDSRAKEHLKKQGLFAELLEDQGRYSIKNLSVNSDQEDFGATYFKDQIVFASSREGTKPILRRWNWNELPFLDIYVANKTSDNDLSDLEELDNSLNHKFHEGPASFAMDGNLIAFTRNNYDGKSSDDVIKLQVYLSEMIDGKWKNEQPFPYNSPEYSIGHPCLTPDGNTMYFASDMPGGYGSVDIYRSTRTADGWSKPENLGNQINTEGKEMFPFYHPDGFLIFASDGHVGLGGLDNFIATAKSDGSFGKIINMGYPINDKKDDFSVVVDQEHKSGYFASNRPGGKGDDDIYSFTILTELPLTKTITGIAQNKDDENPLYNAMVYLKDTEGNILDSVLTDNNGAFDFDAEPDQEYTISGHKDKFESDSKTVSTKGKELEITANLDLVPQPPFSLIGVINDKWTRKPVADVTVSLINLKSGEITKFTTASNGDFSSDLKGVQLNDSLKYEIKLEKDGYKPTTFAYSEHLSRPGQYKVEGLMLSVDLLEELEIGDDLSDYFVINPIYFDLDKSDIRPDAAKELDKIVEIMNDYPSLEIELGSHTDCRASITYNKYLSQRRAKSSEKYIRNHINGFKGRIYGKGYGESKLVNKCSCEGETEVACSEEEHQANRRTEFKVVKK